MLNRAATDICKVELVFHQFDISSNRIQCDSDYVEMPDKQRLCGKLAYQQRVYPFSRSSDYMIIKFISDNLIDKQMTGFWIEVRQIRNSCDFKTAQNGIECQQYLSYFISKVE